MGMLRFTGDNADRSELKGPAHSSRDGSTAASTDQGVLRRDRFEVDRRDTDVHADGSTKVISLPA
jgi:hypothetical protein